MEASAIVETNSGTPKLLETLSQKPEPRPQKCRIAVLPTWMIGGPKRHSIADLLPGVTLASLGWQALQTVGIRLISRQLRRSSELYGTIGAALGLIGFLVLTSQFLVYSLEIATVRKLHLWPRSLIQPPLSDSDKAVLTLMAKQEERWPEETVTVCFDASHPN